MNNLLISLSWSVMLASTISLDQIVINIYNNILN